jgi:hypothetical protein
MLASRGFNAIGARGLAYLTVRVGRRVARESSWRRPAYDAIRFLALPSRQSRAVIPRAKLLLSVWNETSILETTFKEAGLDEFEFVNLLRTIAEGRHAEDGRDDERDGLHRHRRGQHGARNSRGEDDSDSTEAVVRLSLPAQLKRTGKEMKFVVHGDGDERISGPQPSSAYRPRAWARLPPRRKSGPDA